MNAQILSLSTNDLWGIAIIASFLVVFLIVLFCASSRKGRYADNIAYLENAVHFWPVTKGNFEIIFDGFFECLFPENVDSDRTGKLFVEFFIKYERFFIAWLIKEKSVKKVNQEVEV